MMSNHESNHRARKSSLFTLFRMCDFTWVPIVLTTLCLLVGLEASGAPIYVSEYSFGDGQQHVIGGINNAGDVTGSYLTTNGIGTAFLLRNGVLYDLFPTGATPLVDVCYANNLSQRQADGSVVVVGNVHQSGFQRSIVWTVAPNGTFSFLVLSNLVLPPDSTAPGEQGTGDAVAINQSGVVVGNGNSYMAGVGLRWTPPYGRPSEYFYSSVTAVVTIDDPGNVLLNGVEYDHGGASNRWNASLLSSGGALEELPFWSLGFTPVRAMAMSGSRVVGRALTADGHYRACLWTNGAPTLFPLPDPAGMPVQESEAQSVNAAGDVVGYANVAQGASTTFQPGSYAMLWKNSTSGYMAYVLTSLFALENFGTQPLGYSDYRINDSGEVVLNYYFANSNGDYQHGLRVYRPVTNGIVQFSMTGYGAAEEDGFIEAKVNLLRADGNPGPVTVNFMSSDADAVAGVDYVAQNGSVTWNPGESGQKTIRITLLDDMLFAPYRFGLFNLTLTGATGAQLGRWTNVTMSISEPYQTVSFTNQWISQYYGYAVQAGETNVIVTLARSGGADGKMVITSFKTSDSTAMAGLNYVGVTNTTAVTWKSGEAGTTTYSVPLLKPPFPQPIISFSVFAQGYIDDPTNSVFNYATVSIVPSGQRPPTQFETSSPLVQNGTLTLSLRSFLSQGLTLVIEGSTNMVNWKTVVELKCTNGVVQFNPAILTNVPVQVYHGFIK